MVRVAGLVGQANAGVEVKSQTTDPRPAIERVTEVANALMDDQQKRLPICSPICAMLVFSCMRSMSLRPNR